MDESPADRVAPVAGRALIRGAMVWTAAGADEFQPLDILIEHGTISRVGPRGSIEGGESTTSIDAGGMFAIPGLVDMHIHLAPGNATELCVAAGVTAVRDVGNYSEWIFGLREATRSGRIPGPRIFAVGEILEGPIPCRRGFLRASSPREARIAVRALLDRGADGIKIYQSVPPDMVVAAIAEAHRLGVWVAGHLCCMNFIHSWYASESSGSPFQGHERCEGALAAGVEAGLDTIEHAFTASTKVLEPMAARGVAFCPTLGCGGGQGGYHDRRLDPDLDLLFEDPFEVAGRRPPVSASTRRAELWFEAQKDLVRQFSAAGGQVLAGTDSPFGVAPGFGLHRELEILSDCGLSNEQILLAATKRSAKSLRVADRQGTIEPGRAADLVLLQANPFDDISNIRQVHTVIQAGRIYGPPALRRLRESKAIHQHRPAPAARNGRAIVYEARGEGPAVALLADGPGGSAIQVGRRSGHADWFSLSELSLGLRMLFVDPAGSGESEVDVDGLPITPGGMAADLEAVVAAERLDRIAVVAHGASALAALEFALRHPSSLNRLVLVNPVVSPAEMARDVRSLAETAEGGLNASLAHAARDGIYDAVTGAYRLQYWEAARKVLGAAHQPFPLMLGFRYDTWPRRFQWSVYRRLWKPNGEFDIAGEWAGLRLPEGLEGIRAPVLVIVGAYDRPATAQAALLKGRLHDAQFATFHESGHFPFTEEPDRFMRVVRAFLTERYLVGEAWLEPLATGAEHDELKAKIEQLLASSMTSAQTFTLVPRSRSQTCRFVLRPILARGRNGDVLLRLHATDTGATPAQSVLEEPLASHGESQAIDRMAIRLRAWAGDSFAVLGAAAGAA